MTSRCILYPSICLRLLSSQLWIVNCTLVSAARQIRLFDVPRLVSVVGLNFYILLRIRNLRQPDRELLRHSAHFPVSGYHWWGCVMFHDSGPVTGGDHHPRRNTGLLVPARKRNIRHLIYLGHDGTRSNARVTRRGRQKTSLQVRC